MAKQNNAQYAVARGGYSYHKVRDDAIKYDTITTYCGITLGRRGKWAWLDKDWRLLEAPPAWLPLCGRCQRTDFHKVDEAIQKKRKEAEGDEG